MTPDDDAGAADDDDDADYDANAEDAVKRWRSRTWSSRSLPLAATSSAPAEPPPRAQAAVAAVAGAQKDEAAVRAGDSACSADLSGGSSEGWFHTMRSAWIVVSGSRDRLSPRPAPCPAPHASPAFSSPLSPSHHTEPPGRAE